MSKWRNWQTRTIQVRVVHALRVRVPSSTFLLIWRTKVLELSHQFCLQGKTNRFSRRLGIPSLYGSNFTFSPTFRQSPFFDIFYYHPELDSGSIHLILVMLNCGFWQVRRVSVANPARLGESCVEPVEPPIIQDGFSISNKIYQSYTKFVILETLK